MTEASVTIVDIALTLVMSGAVTTPVSVSIVDPAGIVIGAADAADRSEAPRLFDGVNVPQEVPSLPQPTVHVVTLVDIPSALHVVTSPIAHDAVPGVQPQRSTGQSGGVTVQTFVCPSDAGYWPSTSQNGYAGFVQSLSESQPFTCFVHDTVAANAAAQTMNGLIMLSLFDR
jgi:hypothetical protein